MAESILRIGLGKHLDDLGLGEGSAISPLFFVLSECKKDTAKSRCDQLRPNSLLQTRRASY